MSVQQDLRQGMRDRLALHGIILSAVALCLMILGGTLPVTMGSVGKGVSLFLFPIAAGLSLLGLVYSVIGLGSSRKRFAALGILLCIITAVPAVLISFMFIRNVLAVHQIAAAASLGSSDPSSGLPLSLNPLGLGVLS